MKANPLSMSRTVDSKLLSRGTELPNTPQSPPETTEFLLISVLLIYMYRFDDYNLQFTLSNLAELSDVRKKDNGRILTYLLTPWCRVLLEKLTGLQLVKKFPAFHGTRRFITALTSVPHLSLSWASPIQSIYPHPTSWRSILILSTHLSLGLPIGPFPFGYPQRPYTTPSPHPYAPHAQPISFFSILSPAQYWVSSTNHLATRYAISSIPPLPRLS